MDPSKSAKTCCPDPLSGIENWFPQLLKTAVCCQLFWGMLSAMETCLLQGHASFWGVPQAMTYHHGSMKARSTHFKQDNSERPSSSRTFCEVPEAFVGPASHLNVSCPILFLSSLLHLRAIPKGHLCLLVCFLGNSSAIPYLANPTTITIAGTLSSLLLHVLCCLYS